MGLCVQPSKKGSEKTPESRSVIANPQAIGLKKCQIRLPDGRAGNSKGDERVRREWLEKNKALYYKVLHQASNGKFHQEAGMYQYCALVRFFIRILDEALGDISIYRTRYANLQRLPESARKVLDSFKSRPEQLLKVGELEMQTKLPRRTIQYALKNLVAKGFVQRLGVGAGSRYQLVF